MDPAQNLFYCYGCARGGDVIRFAELYHQVKFPQAVTLLREWRGVTPLLEEVTHFYRMRLSRHREAVAYLEHRGLHEPEVIEHMRIGYAPGRCLRGWLNQLGYPLLTLREAGLVDVTGRDAYSASSFHWRIISMAAASWIRWRRIDFCRPVRADCMRGSKSGAPRRLFSWKDCSTSR